MKYDVYISKSEIGRRIYLVPVGQQVHQSWRKLDNPEHTSIDLLFGMATISSKFNEIIDNLLEGGDVNVVLPEVSEEFVIALDLVKL